ncbi:MAG: 30S ribosomal protein S14 [Candidatus Anstonellales archaeon]
MRIDNARGKGERKCKICGTTRGLIRKYGMYICRRCFREHAEKLGFKKYH